MKYIINYLQYSYLLMMTAMIAIVAMVTLGFHTNILAQAPAPAHLEQSQNGEDSDNKANNNGTIAQKRHYKEFRRIREESYVRREIKKATPWKNHSHDEKIRDVWVLEHFKRLALLEVCAELATQKHLSGLSDRVENLRRREHKIYRLGSALSYHELQQNKLLRPLLNNNLLPPISADSADSVDSVVHSNSITKSAFKNGYRNAYKQAKNTLNADNAASYLNKLNLLHTNAFTALIN